MNETKSLTLHIPKAQWDKLHAVAEALGTTEEKTALFAVIAWLKQEERQNEAFAIYKKVCEYHKESSWAAKANSSLLRELDAKLDLLLCPQDRGVWHRVSEWFARSRYGRAATILLFVVLLNIVFLTTIGLAARFAPDLPPPVADPVPIAVDPDGPLIPDPGPLFPEKQAKEQGK